VFPVVRDYILGEGSDLRGWKKGLLLVSAIGLALPGTAFREAEAAAYTPDVYDTVNVAEGKSADVLVGGTPVAGAGAERGIDFDFATYAQAPSNDVWDFRIDLGSIYSVKQIKFTSDADNYAQSYSVKVSADGSNYTEVAQDVIADKEGGVTKTYAFPAEDARFVLIDVDSVKTEEGKSHIIREVEVYDEVAAPNVAYVFSYHAPTGEEQEPGGENELQRLHYNYAIESLQGLVNREGPKLYLERSNYWANGYWNEDWIERYALNNGLSFEEFACVDHLTDLKGNCIYADYELVLKKFRDKLTGIAVYDAEIDGSAQVAMTLAGTDGVLPVPSYLRDQWAPALAGLPVRYDFEGDFPDSVAAYRWALDNGVMGKVDRMYAHTPAGPRVDGLFVGSGPYRAVDWNVMHKGFQFNLTFYYTHESGQDTFGDRNVDGNDAQAEMYREILRALKPGALVVGYGEFEERWFELLSEHDKDYLHWGDNMSFHTKVPIAGSELKQKMHIREDDIAAVEQKYLVAFMASEGDTLKGPLTSYFDTWKSASRGTIPYNWMISSQMSKFPAITEYYYKNATDADYFGAFDIFRFPLSNFERISAEMKEDMEFLDLTSLSGYAGASLPREWMELTDALGLQGFADLDWSTNKGGSLGVTPNGRPYFGQDRGVSYWQAQLYQWGTRWQDKSVEEMATDLAARITEVAQKHAAPFPIVVYGDIHEYPELLNVYSEVMKKLDSTVYKAVRLDEAFATLEKKRMLSNLAFGKTATMNGGTAGWGHDASYTVDGKFDTYAQSSQDVLWGLDIDLESVQTINTVEFTPDEENYAVQYEIQTSVASGGPWTTVATENTGQGKSKTYRFPAVQAQYVKIKVNNRHNWNHAIREVEIYNHPINLASQKNVRAHMIGDVTTEPWGHVASHIVDGTTKYAQAYNVAPNPDPVWDFFIDLGSVQDINTVVFTPDEKNFATKYDVLTSEDGVTYVKRSSQTAGKSGPDVHSFPTVQAQYVKFDVIERGSTDDAKKFWFPHSVREVEVYNLPRNLALNKDAYMFDGGVPGWGHVPANMTDGNPATYAQSDQDVPWDARVDLGAVQSINTVVVNPEKTNYASAYEIWTSEDGLSYSQRAAEPNGAGYAAEYSFAPVKARFIEVRVSARANWNHAIEEIEVYLR